MKCFWFGLFVEFIRCDQSDLQLGGIRGVQILSQYWIAAVK